MIQTIALLGMLALTFAKLRESSGLQKIALITLGTIILTMLSVISWQGGTPQIDADGTRDRLIQNLKNNGTDTDQAD